MENGYAFGIQPILFFIISIFSNDCIPKQNGHIPSTNLLTNVLSILKKGHVSVYIIIYCN